jgi:LacI family transcriptional regulator
MANIKMADVAKAAGVSLATVGRVIHNNGYVAEDKRKEIEQIIKDMGYVPNKMAQALKYSQSKLIGHMTLFNQNMLYEKISSAIDASAVNKGYHVLTLASHFNQGEEAQQIEELIGRRVEGIIITSNFSIDPNLITKLVDIRIPVVMIERAYDMPFVDRVLVDDFKGAYDAVKHILEKGHRRVGFIGKDQEHEVEINRYNGYCKAVSEYRLPVHPELIQKKPDYSISFGYEAVKTLMEGANPPTAIFMTSDIYACGVMQYLYEKNIKVPKDIGLIGYDNTLATMLAPSISSIGLPYQDIAESAMELLLTRMEDGKVPARTVMISTRLIDRGTVRETNK